MRKNRALKRLEKVQKSIDKFSKAHSGSLSKRQHKKIRKLLKKRASALSDVTGMKIYPIFD